jgi:septum formation protein
VSVSRPRLILASASLSRRRVLDAAGIGYEPIASEFEEWWSPGDDPTSTVLSLARGKATTVAAGRESAYVLGCDSLFSFGGRLLGKPADNVEATVRWEEMRGHSGVLHTGHVLVHDEYVFEEAVATTVTFATPTTEELAAYVASHEPIGVAGAFTMEGRSAAFIERIEGDPSNVLGLSVAALRRLLANAGVPISALWI